MIRFLTRFFRDQSGANAVEFALVATPLLLLLFGSMEFGRLFWSSHAIQQVAISTARCVALPQQECRGNAGLSLTQARDFARDNARSWMVSVDVDAVTIDPDTICRSVGLPGFVTVEITHQFDSVVPGLLTAFNGGTALLASACFPRQV